MANEICNINNKSCLYGLNGSLKNKIDNLCKDSPHSHDLIMKYGYSTKEFHHIIRYGLLINDYINGIPLQFSLIPKNRKLLLDIKTGKKKFSPDEAKQIADRINKLSKYNTEQYFKTHDFFDNKDTIKKLDNWCFNILIKSFYSIHNILLWHFYILKKLFQK